MDELRHTDNLFKTSLCIQFAKGKCKNSKLCRYAHGVDELRKLTSNSDSVEANENDKKCYQQIEDINNFEKRSFYNDDSVSVSDVSEISKSDRSREQVPMYNPSKFRYNYLNPFFFYSINNFPVQQYVNTKQTMPFFNYITISKSIQSNSTEASKTDSGLTSTRGETGLTSTQNIISELNNNDMSQSKKNETVARS